MPAVTANAVISPHPAPVVDLETDEPPPLEVFSAPVVTEPPTPSVKREPSSRPTYDPEIYCGVPPLPAGWCQPDFTAPSPPLKKQRIEPVPPPPLISVAELACSLGIALVAGMVFGGSISYLLSKPKIVCQA